MSSTAYGSANWISRDGCEIAKVFKAPPWISWKRVAMELLVIIRAFAQERQSLVRLHGGIHVMHVVSREVNAKFADACTGLIGNIT